METDNTGTVQAIYNYGNGLISMNRAGVNSYYNYDGLGSTRQLTDSSEAVVASYTYDGFGNKIAGTGTSENVYGFTGEQQFNEADNLVFLRARYYKPSISRFISRDPIGYKGGINLYAYVRNNPQTYTDPLGKSIWSPITCGVCIGCIIGELLVCDDMCDYEPILCELLGWPSYDECFAECWREFWHSWRAAPCWVACGLCSLFPPEGVPRLRDIRP